MLVATVARPGEIPNRAAERGDREYGAGRSEIPLVHLFEMPREEAVRGRSSIQPLAEAPQRSGVCLPGCGRERGPVDLADRQIDVQLRSDQAFWVVFEPFGDNAQEYEQEGP